MHLYLCYLDVLQASSGRVIFIFIAGHHGLSSTNNIIMTQNYTNTNTCTSLWRYYKSRGNQKYKTLSPLVLTQPPHDVRTVPHMTHKGIYIILQAQDNIFVF